MRRLVVAALTATLVVALTISAAVAVPRQTTPPTQATPTAPDLYTTYASGGDEPSVSVSYTELATSGGAPAGREAAAVRPRTCELWEAPGGPGSMGTENQPRAPVQGDLVDGAWYYQTCRYTDTGELASSRYWEYVAGAPGFGPDLAALAASAYDRIPLPFPVPSTSPSLDVRPITGLDTWLWIDPSSWQTREATAALAGFRVTVTATPVRVVWDLGEGEAPVTCEGPGTVFQDDGPDSQTTDCSYTYRWNSHDQPGDVFRASATVEWAVAWTASTGATGVLAPGRRTTTFDVSVKSIEAQICSGGNCPEGDA